MNTFQTGFSKHLIQVEIRAGGWMFVKGINDFGTVTVTPDRNDAAEWSKQLAKELSQLGYRTQGVTINFYFSA